MLVSVVGEWGEYDGIGVGAINSDMIWGPGLTGGMGVLLGDMLENGVDLKFDPRRGLLSV